MEIVKGLIIESVTQDGSAFVTTFTNGYSMVVDGGSADGYGWTNLTIYDENDKELFDKYYPN